MLLITLGLTGLVALAALAGRTRATVDVVDDDRPIGVGTYSIATLPDFRYRQERFFADGRYWR